ncbi:MAG: translation initiation factor IF-5A [Candidatus Lokiarchaeota archaeon]|nr:translation initiation factor IF-5A [Candidatus Lokiarchaeota archaeon]
MSIKRTEVKSLKEGSYMLIDDEPCRIVSIEKSKPGKHGSAKANIMAVGFFDNRKRNVVMPADRMAEVPIIDKRTATVIADQGERLNIMDTESYETYEVSRPDDEEVSSQIETNCTVEYWDVMGTKVIMRVKS